MSAGAAVEVRGIEKHFNTDAGPVRAVDGISVAVAAGTSLAITGPSGCGKSTLLSLIGGLEIPSAGQVTIDGHVVSDMSEADRARLRRERLGFVFQSHNLQPFMTAVENIGFQLALSGAAAGYERSLELLAGLGLGAAAGKYPDQLSGGERQRVAVGRALVHRPGLILADEPTGALDWDNSEVVINLLLAAQSEVGATLILITHDAGIAARLDRRLALRDGVMVDDADAGVPPTPGSAGV